MKLDVSDIKDLRPVIAAVVAEVLAELRADESKIGEQLAMPEPQAAAALGIASHVLRDCRLRGEISGSRVGKRIIYERGELLKFLERSRAK